MSLWLAVLCTMRTWHVLLLHLHLHLHLGRLLAPSCGYCSCSCAPRGPVARPSVADIGGDRRGCALREAAGQKGRPRAGAASRLTASL